jgi:hypothetical protein
MTASGKEASAGALKATIPCKGDEHIIHSQDKNYLYLNQEGK